MIFFFFGLNVSRNIANKVRSNVTLLIINKLLGLNTLGISLVCLDFAPYDPNPSHTHPYNTKHLVVKDGTFLVGFVTSNPNKLFTKVLNKGHFFIFPIGLLFTSNLT
ncbi:germin-like protein subfamily 1 member 11 [Quercus suber]|uniref:Germin-like protein n=1 Tax=Quercus suber TaxID=58331 RepID=A0AAW0LTK4_QUESU